MEKKRKHWETALLAGLLIGLLAGQNGGTQLPLSRWQEGDTALRYEVTLFPFAVFEREEQALAVPMRQGTAEKIEVRFFLLEWWQSLTDQNPARGHSSARE